MVDYKSITSSLLLILDIGPGNWPLQLMAIVSGVGIHHIFYFHYVFTLLIYGIF